MYEVNFFGSGAGYATILDEERLLKQPGNAQTSGLETITEQSGQKPTPSTLEPPAAYSTKSMYL